MQTTGFPTPELDTAGGGSADAGGILFGDVNGLPTTNSSSLFWDSTNLKQTITGTIGAQQRLAYDGTHVYDFKTDSTGRLNLNGTDITWIRKSAASVPSAAWYFTNLVLSVAGEETTGGGTIIACQHADSVATDSYEFTGYRAGGTLAAPTACQQDWRLGRYASVAFGTTFTYVASLDFYAWENYDATHGGSYATIRCTPLGSLNSQQVARFNGDGTCSLLSTCQVGDGSNTAMAFGFNSAGGGIPGFFKYGAGFLGFASVSGRTDMVLGQQSIYVMAGTAFKFSSSTSDAGTSVDVAFSRSAANVLAPTADNSYDWGDASFRWRNIRWGSQLLGPDGSNTTPAFTFASQSILGFYKYASGFLGFSSVSGRADMVVGQQSFYMIAGTSFRWSSGTTDAATATDTVLTRNAAGYVSLGTTTQGALVGHDGTNAYYRATAGQLAFALSVKAVGDTTGYMCIPASAGAPTGVPASIPSGSIPFQLDSTNKKLYAYIGGAWTKAQASGVDVIFA